MTTRRIGALNGFGQGVLITEAVPELAFGQVRVRVHASLISPGTELNGCRGLRERPDPDAELLRFGYQNAGVIEALGEGVKGFAVGDRVACMGGLAAMHTDVAIVPQRLCARMPDNVSYEAAAGAHLAMTSLNAIRRGKVQLGEHVLVVGLGLVGQLAAMLAQRSGAYVMGWDTNAFRCDVARKNQIGQAVQVMEEDADAAARAFTRGEGFDMAVMAFGGEASKVLQQVASVMSMSPDGHEMGRICLVGGCFTTSQWAAALGNLDLLSCARTGPGYHDEAWETGSARDYTHPFMRWTTRTNMELVLRLMSEGRLDMESLITHRFALDDIGQAVDVLVEHPEQALGVILTMQS